LKGGIDAAKYAIKFDAQKLQLAKDFNLKRCWHWNNNTYNFKNVSDNMVRASDELRSMTADELEKVKKIGIVIARKGGTTGLVKDAKNETLIAIDVEKETTEIVADIRRGIVEGNL
jgi:hypothetical protein